MVSVRDTYWAIEAGQGVGCYFGVKLSKSSSDFILAERFRRLPPRVEKRLLIVRLSTLNQ